MGILRSEEMKHGTLALPVERARQFMDVIGRSTNMMFEDMNARDMRRPYKRYIQRIDEMERILRFLFDEVNKMPGAEVIKNRVDDFLERDEGSYKLDAIEAELNNLYNQFMKFRENNQSLTEERNAAVEEKCVMNVAKGALAAGAMQSRARQGRMERVEGDDFSASRPLLEETESGRGGEMQFSNIAGVVLQADQDRFARMLFRATRGNTFTHFQQIPEMLKDPTTGKEVAKSVFVVYFQDSQGSTTSAIAEKVRKLCASFGVNLYRWPANRQDAEDRERALKAMIDDKEKALTAFEQHMKAEAEVMLAPPTPTANSLIEEWRLFCIKEKAIYATLNCFEGDITLRANCWYPAAEEDHIKQLLVRQSNNTQTNAFFFADRDGGEKRNPPTYIRKNDLTALPQELVDTYGVPRYQEANPALLTVVTFPFMFGIMYGDVGHGFMLLLIGLWACWNANSLKYSIPGLYSARYFVCMMGFFSMYAGFMYNDFFSLGFNFFGSRWKPIHGHGNVEYFEPAYDVKNSGGLGPYPFGLDPAWHGANNELLFLNSLKMKISVLFGVAHMIVGLMLRFGNAVHERSAIDFFGECVPMLVFMLCFFAYMDWMILYKWVTPMDNPPSIINALICMAMRTPDSTPLYDGQQTVQAVLMLLTLISVPMLLIPKPLILWMQNRSSSGGGGHGGDGEAGASKEQSGHGHDMGEIVIHQIIETIEYVLGTVSHTASYLRLWALSLAHQQLALVFFQKTIMVGLTTSFPINVVVLVVMFACWFGVTVGVLMGMDVMECFLHTLRLHWVEFQSKFYKSEGSYLFEPYQHKALLEPKSKD